MSPKLLCLAALCLVVASFSTVGCQSTTPPQADTETMDSIIAGSTELLLTDVREADSAQDLFLAFVGIENRGADPLNAALADANEAVSEILVNAKNNPKTKSFRMISEHQVGAAMKAASISRHEQLTLAEPRERFVAQLTKEGQAPQYLMFGSLTTSDSGDQKVEERRFKLTLELMHATSGEIVAKRSATYTGHSG